MDLFSLKQGQKYRRIVAYVWRRRNRALRADVMRDLNSSKATVIGAVDRLLRAGILTETASPNGRQGRQPKTLGIAGNQCFAIGISVRSGLAEIAVVDGARQVRVVEKVTALERDGKKQLARLLRSVTGLLRRCKFDLNRLVGVGVTMPGMIDHRLGFVRKSSSFLDPDGVTPIIPFWERTFKKPCRLMERSAALAFNEHAHGAAAGMRDFLYLDGMGLGMFLDGRIYMGHQCYGGEIGLMKISDANLPEGDGRVGTYNRASKFAQIGLRLEEAIARGAATLAADMIKAGRASSLQVVIDAALQGDSLCRGMLEEGFQSTAEMAVNLNYLLNPEAIFLWPWTAQCPDISLDIVRRRMDICRVINPDMQVKILPAQCGEDSLASGIAMLPLNDFFM